MPESTIQRPGLRNLHPVGDKFWSGSTPEGDDGFRSLCDLGVQTIVSVDGVAPDVERAKRFGLQYVHVPVGYGGVTRDQELRLARAAALPGPIYVHCHNGQHRGPTAAALMWRCRADGGTPDDAVTFLQTAGTDPKYDGLYAAVRDFRPPSADELRAVPATLPEVVDVGGLAARMAEIDRAWDDLKKHKGESWKALATWNSAGSLGLRLHEGYREAGRLPDMPIRGESFRARLDEAERVAHELEVSLRAGDTLAADKAFERSAALCTSCHRDFRDRQAPR